MHTFSQEAMERPFRTLQAAGVLRENAETIGRAAAGAGEDEIIVAVVHKDLSYREPLATRKVSHIPKNPLYLKEISSERRKKRCIPLHFEMKFSTLANPQLFHTPSTAISGKIVRQTPPAHHLRPVDQTISLLSALEAPP